MLGRRTFEEMASDEESEGEGATVMLDGMTSPFADSEEPASKSPASKKEQAAPPQKSKAPQKPAPQPAPETDEEEPEEGSTLMLDSAALAAQIAKAEKRSAASESKAEVPAQPSKRKDEAPSAAPEAEEEPESGATMMLDADKVAELAKERAEARAAAAEGEGEPEAGATMMLDAAKVAAATRGRLGDGSDESTAAPAKSKQPVAPRAGIYSRRQTGEQKIAKRAEAAPETEEPVAKIDPAVQRRLVMGASIVFVAIALGIFLKTITSVDQPSDDQLMLLYPYGIIDSTEPGGRFIPGAMHVRFSYEGTVPCQKDSSVECLKYSYSKDKFEGTMLIKQSAQGWERFDAEPIRTAP